jgi:uncharacterized membrane protein
MIHVWLNTRQVMSATRSHGGGTFARRARGQALSMTSTTTAEVFTLPTTGARIAARITLASAMIFAGLSHLFWARKDFQAQVPRSIERWMDLGGVVMASGGVELMLGAGLAVLTRDRVRVGRILAAFYVAVSPGNIAQFVHKRDAFGLTSDRRRVLRLAFPPVLIAWPLWSTAVPRLAG